MTERDESVRLRHMLDAAKEAVELVGARTRLDLDHNRLLQLALTHLIGVIGEAATRTPVAVRDRFTFIPWSQIMTMRNRLIHGYDSVDYEIVWRTATSDLPDLIPLLERAIQELKP